MERNFKNKVVAISGAARGIGEAMTREFLRLGARVVALDRLWEASDPFHLELMRNGDFALALSCDITSSEEVEKAYSATMSKWGTVDVLINNAAMRQRDLYPANGASTVLDTLDSHWDRMFSVNVTGAVRLTRAFVQPMLRQRSGSIVNVSASGSVTIDEGGGVYSGTHPHLLNQPYDASKAAMTSMSFYLADEIRAHNVAVNVLFPGATRTTGSEALAQGRRSAGVPMVLLEPSHLIPLTLYLASQAGNGVTGRAFDARKWVDLETK
jgi:NAD(P)-dependent dehydrogenase (short-subunit alcohol dehydrogenase family)